MNATTKSLTKPVFPILTFFFFLLLLQAFQSQANVYDEPVMHIAIPLLDDDGNNVLDTGNPYSSRQTCGGCHDYEGMAHAFHFEAGRDEADDDYGFKRGLSVLVSPGYFGGYNCMGGNNSYFLSKKHNSSAADFGDEGSAGLAKHCAYCHAGGGWMEKDRNGVRYDQTDPSTVTAFDGDYYNRGTDENNEEADRSVVTQWDWKKSGVVENDCLKCHADLTNLTLPDAEINSTANAMIRNVRITSLIGKGHFREANTATLEILNLNTSGNPEQDITAVSFNRVDQAVSMHGMTIPADGVLADTELLYDESTGKPTVTWNQAAFTDGKVQIPMLRYPANDNCMACHLTSNSRRGFYGFGEGAEAVTDEVGVLVEDYQDDVHKGKVWREDNGEERTIENCNSCHARNYFNPPSSSPVVDASHAFLKGNSDMDVHNELDFNPNAKSCEYCHNDSPQAAEMANPSGDADMLTAHLKIWTFNNDMSGYPQDSLERITQTHLDIVSCQACHITDKAIRGVPMTMMYRYREAANGEKTIVPYKPHARYFWRDKTSGLMLNQTQRNSVFRQEVDAEGQVIGGLIVDPESEEILGTVSVGVSHGALRYSDPDSYEGFVALKQAYDKVYKSMGVENPDAVIVWSDVNNYLVSHNTRPAVASVQCEECHNYKSDGTTISALVSNDGIFGVNNSYEITTLPDPRLVTEGIVTFDYPYIKMDENGVVRANASDILAYSKIDPSMSALRSAVVSNANAVPKNYGTLEQVQAAIGEVGISNTEDIHLFAEQYRNTGAYVFRFTQGDAAIRDVVVIGGDSDLSKYMLQIDLGENDVTASAARAGQGELLAGTEVYQIQFRKPSGEVLETTFAPVLVKLPYHGSDTDVESIRVISSVDGISWSAVDPVDILALRAQSDDADGYIVFRTTHFSYYATTSVAASSPASSVDPSSVDRNGGVLNLLSIMLLSLLLWLKLKLSRKALKG